MSEINKSQKPRILCNNKKTFSLLTPFFIFAPTVLFRKAKKWGLFCFLIRLDISCNPYKYLASENLKARIYSYRNSPLLHYLWKNRRGELRLDNTDEKEPKVPADAEPEEFKAGFNPESELSEQPGHFKSSFKGWIRTVALVVVLVFTPEQISWAMNYNPYVLWKDQAAHSVKSDATPEEVTVANIAGNVEHLLNQIAYKENPRINLKLSTSEDEDPELSEKSILINSSIFFTKNRIKNIYSWLRDPKIHPINCGIYALRDLLTANDVMTKLEELSIVTIIVDLMNNIVQPGDQKLKTSLFSINEVAKAYGLKYKSFKIPSLDILNLPTPFIASLQDEHFVLVTAIDEQKVYFTDIGQGMSLTREEFSNKATGYVLAAQNNPITSAEEISDTDMAFVWGSRYRGRYDEMPGLSNKQLWTAAAIQVGMTVLSAGMTGGFTSASTMAAGTFIGATSSMFGGTVGQVGQQEFGWSDRTAFIVSSVVSAGVSMGANAADAQKAGFQKGADAAGKQAVADKVAEVGWKAAEKQGLDQIYQTAYKEVMKNFSAVSTFAKGFLKGAAYGYLSAQVKLEIDRLVNKHMSEKDKKDPWKLALADLVTSAITTPVR